MVLSVPVPEQRMKREFMPEKVSIVKAIVDGPNLVLPIYPIGQKDIPLFLNTGFPRMLTMTNLKNINSWHFLRKPTSKHFVILLENHTVKIPSNYIHSRGWHKKKMKTLLSTSAESRPIIFKAETALFRVIKEFQKYPKVIFLMITFKVFAVQKLENIFNKTVLNTKT